MIKIIIEDVKGEYKYKTVCILKDDIIVDRFRINHALATETQIRSHPLYGVRVGRWEKKKIEIKRKPQGKKIGWGSVYKAVGSCFG